MVTRQRKTDHANVVNETIRAVYLWRHNRTRCCLYVTSQWNNSCCLYVTSQWNNPCCLLFVTSQQNTLLLVCDFTMKEFVLFVCDVTTKQFVQFVHEVAAELWFSMRRWITAKAFICWTGAASPATAACAVRGRRSCCATTLTAAGDITCLDVWHQK